ncbi:hypothetical protein BM1_04026 [Bipolaris maydis]|nr:hypothetical protein BM1_04026 [Bipolaris maydis]
MAGKRLTLGCPLFRPVPLIALLADTQLSSHSSEVTHATHTIPRLASRIENTVLNNDTEVVVDRFLWQRIPYQLAIEPES